MTQLTLPFTPPDMTPDPKDVCVFCGKSHSNSKKDDVKSPGWKREAISGVGSRYKSKKETIYPEGETPPRSYKSAGHHCVALSCFINSKKVDKNLKLNHFLSKAGYNPNNLDNCIDLPSKDEQGENAPEFVKALDIGKPLQIHIGGHVANYFNHCRTLTQDLNNFFAELDQCKEPEKKWLEDLLKAMHSLEDEAFQETAAARPPYILHPSQLKQVENLAISNGMGPIEYPDIKIAD